VAVPSHGVPGAHDLSLETGRPHHTETIGHVYADGLGSGDLGRLLLNGRHGCSRPRPFALLQPVS
jgi:hypothetical protein